MAERFRSNVFVPVSCRRAGSFRTRDPAPGVPMRAGRSDSRSVLQLLPVACESVCNRRKRPAALACVPSGPRSGLVAVMLSPDVAVETRRRGEPFAAVGAAEWRGSSGGRRRRRRCGGVSGAVSLAVSLQEGYPAEPAAALLALRPNPPPLPLKDRKRCQLAI